MVVLKGKGKIASWFSASDAPCSLLAQLRIQFSTDLRVQKMFEILLDENSEKEKREKVRTAPALPKLLLFNARGPCEELKVTFPSPDVISWRNLSVGSELCTSPASWAPPAPTSTSQVWEFAGGVLEAGVVLLTCPPASPQQAANNLIVLGREEAGAERIFQNNGVSLLLQLIETKNAELILAAVRTLSGMCTGHKARVSSGVLGTFTALVLHLGSGKSIIGNVYEQRGFILLLLLAGKKMKSYKWHF